jgi:hypothetical protein
MQFDVFSFLSGMIATLVLGFVFRRMFAFRVNQTHIHHHPSPDSITAEAMQKSSQAKRLQALANPLRQDAAEKKTSGHVGKLINFEVARKRLTGKRSREDEVG